MGGGDKLSYPSQQIRPHCLANWLGGVPASDFNYIFERSSLTSPNKDVEGRTCIYRIHGRGGVTSQPAVMESRSPDGGRWGEIEVVEEANAGAGAGAGGVLLPVTPNSRNNSVEEEDVYVAVGEGSSSMDALTWALKHVARPSGIVYLVHVFPAVHHVPTPLGMLPRDQVSQAQVNSYLDQERVKRRDMLQKFLAECQKSRMNFDTHLIESDQIVKAVSELIEVLHIKRLIVGVNKSNSRKLKKGSCKAVQIQKSSPQYCEVKIICEGREVRDPEQSTAASPAPESLSHDKNTTDGEISEAKQGAVSCSCFSVKLL